MSFALCPECKSMFKMSVTGTVCDACYYRKPARRIIAKLSEHEKLETQLKIATSTLDWIAESCFDKGTSEYAKQALEQIKKG